MRSGLAILVGSSGPQLFQVTQKPLGLRQIARLPETQIHRNQQPGDAFRGEAPDDVAGDGPFGDRGVCRRPTAKQTRLESPSERPIDSSRFRPARANSSPMSSIATR